MFAVRFDVFGSNRHAVTQRATRATRNERRRSSVATGVLPEMPEGFSKRKSPGQSSQTARGEADNHSRFFAVSNARGAQSSPRRIHDKVTHENTKISTHFISSQT